MTTFGHCSRQVEGGRKLMGQPLVHPQRLGSLVGVFSCSLIRDEQGLVVHSQSSASCWGPFDLGLLTWAGSFGPGCVHPTKWTTDVGHGLPFLMDFC